MIIITCKHSKSENIEIMISDEADEVITQNVKSNSFFE